MSVPHYPFPLPPAAGTTTEVAPGVYWLRMALPFQLDHINLWLLEDGTKEDPAWLIVDSGLGDDPTRALWEKIFAGRIGASPVRRVLVTHYHPDHAGNAAWLCNRFGANLWMSRGEFLTVHAARNSSAGYTTEAQLELFRANGLDDARGAELLLRGGLYKTMVPEFPFSHRRLFEGERLTIGGREWRVIVGHGHAPEHVSLRCEALNVLISGDMLLPRISTNVAVRSIDPWSNPLKLFLESIARYRELPEDVLVLPSHGLPFRGAHARIEQLEAHHRERLAELQAACVASPRAAAEVLEILFRRKLDTSQIFFAMGEAIAHLHYLHYEGGLSRSVGADGVARFAPV
ncbi:MAG: MBL fold metallo-hydrolase [Candidatus Parcubacteria bacterium]|nr:MBL fold metallo-hydrolase [Burkholderiales bacterium]